MTLRAICGTDQPGRHRRRLHRHRREPVHTAQLRHPRRHPARLRRVGLRPRRHRRGADPAHPPGHGRHPGHLRRPPGRHAVVDPPQSRPAPVQRTRQRRWSGNQHHPGRLRISGKRRRQRGRTCELRHAGNGNVRRNAFFVKELVGQVGPQQDARLASRTVTSAHERRVSRRRPRLGQARRSARPGCRTAPSTQSSSGRLTGWPARRPG